MNNSNRLKQFLLENVKEYCKENSYKGVERNTAFLFNDISMNFFKDSYENICNNNDYKKRLFKSHSKVPGFKEMQSSNSSDALLMNIFANPKILTWRSIQNLLSITSSDKIEFGWNPEFNNENTYKTEIDMLIGKNIFEAKLTEKSFTNTSLNTIQTYQDAEHIFDLLSLTEGGKVYNYQLLRNILVAYKYNFNFFLILDERRTDLIREFYRTKFAIKDKLLANRCNFITWQEITACLGKELKQFITKKYLF